MPEGVVEQPHSIRKVQKYVAGTDWELQVKQLDLFFIADCINNAKTKKAFFFHQHSYRNLPAYPRFGGAGET